MATQEQFAEEDLRARKVRRIVDLAASLIMQSGLTRHEAENLVRAARTQILALFPDGEQTYELIYAPRFRRLIEEFARPEPGRSGLIIPFPRPCR